MINSIVNAITTALNAEFGDDYRIYTEKIEQGLKEPCFFVQCINPTNERFLGNRYKRTNQFCIQYFPSTEEKYSECMDVTEKLFFVLDNLNNEWMGTNMKSNITDDILSFFVTYTTFVYRTKEHTPMETIEHQGRVIE